MDVSGDSMEASQGSPQHNRRPPTARPMPATPSLRLALSWLASTQGSRGKAAACRCCIKQFDRGELRLAKESDFASNSGRHFHLSCIPGGLHAHDIVQGEPTNDPDVVAALVAARAPPPEARAEADRASFVGVVPSDLKRSFAFWSSWDWKSTFRRQHNTLIDVPKSLQSAYAERKSAIIAEILELPHDDPSAIPMWRCLSMFDALVLNSSRQSDESQCEVVSRRLEQVDDGDWCSLLQGCSDLFLRPRASNDPKLARKNRKERVHKLAISGEHSRAMRAVEEPPEIMRDASRLQEVKDLYPPNKGGPINDLQPQEWTDEDFEGLAAAVARDLRRSPVRTSPGPLGSHLSIGLS